MLCHTWTPRTSHLRPLTQQTSSPRAMPRSHAQYTNISLYSTLRSHKQPCDMTAFSVLSVVHVLYWRCQKLEKPAFLTTHRYSAKSSLYYAAQPRPLTLGQLFREPRLADVEMCQTMLDILFTRTDERSLLQPVLCNALSRTALKNESPEADVGSTAPSLS